LLRLKILVSMVRFRPSAPWMEKNPAPLRTAA